MAAKPKLYKVTVTNTLFILAKSEKDAAEHARDFAHHDGAEGEEFSKPREVNDVLDVADEAWLDGLPYVTPSCGDAEELKLKTVREYLANE